MTAKPDPMVDDVLTAIRELNCPIRCAVAVALAEVSDAAREAFEIALRDRERYQHAAIAKRLNAMSGQPVPPSSVGRHRKFLLGESGGCRCARP